VSRSCRGKVALVTGGSRGIGRATALRLAGEGAKVAIVARALDDVRMGRSLAGTLAELGDRGHAIVGDLSDPAFDGDGMVAEVEGTLGPIDILVNNAALGGFRSFLEVDDDYLRAIQQVNVWTPWQLTRRVFPDMLQRGRGWIVNVSSGASLPTSGALVGSTAYGGTKAMLNQWTRALAAELADTPIVLSAIAPQGASRTEYVEVAVRDGHLPAELVEPLAAMSEAILTLATAEPGTVHGEFRKSLERLVEVGRPVIDFTDGSVVPGYDVDDLPARLAAMQAAAAVQHDLRGELTN
jgi:citronellol/citronellal dehydrogenase